MSRSVERMRLRKYLSDLDTMAGDSETTALATGGVAELLATAGKLGAGVQAKQEADKKAAEDKKKSDADAAAHEQLVSLAKKARAQADADANAARLAAMKAGGEKESYGPLHVAAQNAADKAQLSARTAAEAEAKAGIGALLPSGAAGGKAHGGGFTMPTWGWWALGGVGAVGVGFVGYRMMRGGRR